MSDTIANPMHYGPMVESRFSRAIVSRVKPPDGWAIASVSPYCGSMSYLVWEFVKDDRCVTLYGDVLAVQDAMLTHPELLR